MPIFQEPKRLRHWKFVWHLSEDDALFSQSFIIFVPVVLDLLKSENEHKNIASNQIYINPITLKAPYSESPKSLVFIHVWFVGVSTFNKFQIQQESTIVAEKIFKKIGFTWSEISKELCKLQPWKFEESLTINVCYHMQHFK